MSDMKDDWYNLPLSGATRSFRRYVREWRVFTRPLAKALHAKCIGYDPNALYAIGGMTSLRVDRRVIAAFNTAAVGDASGRRRKVRQ